MGDGVVDITDLELARADVKALRAALVTATRIIVNAANDMRGDPDMGDEVDQLDGFVGWFRQVLEATGGR